jgi:integral membrane sensor domain MASE1
MALDRSALRSLGVNALLACAYWLAGMLGLSLHAEGGFAALLWLPSGLALAVLARSGLRYASGVLLGALAGNLWAGAPVPVALAIALGNVAEAALGASALRRFGFSGSFDRLRHVLALVVPCAMLSTLVSATVTFVPARASSKACPMT